ncbi:excinuclease ABC subunit B [Candidatus Berkelbacteria bacterium RIFCSPLOWO2_01_FULL_50_28]|uniref:UvrABC system protein B n=1 Tax=Candidatus Berkelbacteria bacterium RIFCSPLOWO2_01_FULL_50_28 TaxID=1797471 RepID=A0A1F5EC36_9BACT|nr:MAG: excinuclease ABC subunit B [Candidatus Berkelbacteria bacterium RIFCSPHIGHO2_01_FULL_50_36]OGD64945.1 MAG: excinuclease ABC subunit B [Candidatus Berkelbacteria bacterium RIFCSPLOWO2_01_FULL_50_28]
MKFELATDMKPAGDQPKAIKSLVKGIKKGLKHQVLLGVTGSGKTFTAANVIVQVQKPTLVIAHNKTLAAQLTSEFRHFFPKNAVEYFVSYYDYYQPEAYMPNSDTYIEKEAQINDEIDRLRHAATQAVLSRRDVIIVASVSCIYGLGSAEEYQKATLVLTKGEKVDRDAILAKLVFLQYQRNDVELARGDFRARGEIIEVMPSNATTLIRIKLDGDSITDIQELDHVTGGVTATPRFVVIYPSRHFVTPPEQIKGALKSIETELKDRLKVLEKENKGIEADRLTRRTLYDMEMIREVGYCNGIENYSRHFDGRAPGATPNTLLNYFPEDFLTIIDESHVTVPQIGGMFNGDKARKEVLVDYGFRLPSAKDNRPLRFAEFEKKVGQTVYTSATPGNYELEKTEQTVEQVIRPTGLVDPEIIIRPLDNQVGDLMERAKERVKREQRVLITTLTKKMAEDLTDYFTEQGIRVRYLHSGIETLERIEILRELRKGTFDVLVGVNLLREGLDLPEVSLVGILDADKEGFLRSDRSLIQTIGRAARNVQGQVVLYADIMTGSLTRAIDETNRRREIQVAHNKKHGITPTTISKEITSIVEQELAESVGLDKIETQLAKSNIESLIKDKERSMKLAAQELQFELAAILRDEVIKLKKMQKERQKTASSLDFETKSG